jgi:DNA-binding XRE family transcriptional regulator
MQNPFHKIMCRRRIELRLSQAQAAARAGVARSTWNAWEHVDEFPRRDVWPVIAKVLEIQIDELQRAAATNWFLQIGLSSEQLSLMEMMGLPLDGPAPDFSFYSEALKKLDRDLELDLSRIADESIGDHLATLRSGLKNAIFAHDATFRALSQMVESFRAIAFTVLPERSHNYFAHGKRAIVRKKPTKPSPGRKK